MYFFNFLKNKLIVLFLLIGLIPALVVGSLLYINARQEIKEKTEETLDIHAESVSKSLERYFSHRENDAVVLASTPCIYESVYQLEQGNWNIDDPEWKSRKDEIDNLAESVLTEYDLNSFYITDARGILIYEANPEAEIPLGLDLTEKSEFYQKSLNGEPSWNSQTYFELSDSINLIVSMPIFKEGTGDEVIGTINLSMGQQEIDDLVNNGLRDFGETINAYLIDQDGLLRTNTFLNDYSTGSALKETISSPAVDILREPINQKEFDFSSTEEYQSYRGNHVLGHLAVTRLGDNPVGLIVEIEHREIFAGIITLRNFGILILFLCTLLIIILSFYISDSITEPIERITEWSKELAEGNYSSRKVFSEYEELKVLSVTYNKMIEKIENRELKLSEQKEELQASYQQLKAYSDEITDLNEKLEYQALHDPLTELPNRRQFLTLLEAELINDKKGAVALLDLKNFKEINDSLGHVFGDKILSEVGRRLLEIADEKKDMFVARYGGDEFLILIKNVQDVDLICQKLSDIENQFKSPFQINGNQIKLKYSLGITLFPVDAANTYELITNADTAMYKAKEKVGNKKTFFNQDMILQLQEKQKIKSILERALENDGFLLNYQPQVNLQTNKADSYEALIRLRNHDISPDKFIPVAEESSLIIDIGRWVTEAVIKHLVTCRKKGLELKPISINFSAKQLDDQGYIEFLKQKLAQKEIPPELIEIEITESILLERTKKSLNFLTDLKKVGVRIALDDFGTGYSSLSYLTYIDLDKIKLDRSLNNKFLQKEHLATMNNLINLFNSMDLTVVAEGIEVKEQYLELKNMGCDYIQGYLFSRPVPPEEMFVQIEQKFFDI
ncbi:MAG: EAL domain-containing protein [Halanaerobiaceae bacterium]